MTAPRLATLRLPIPWEGLGLPSAPMMGATTLLEGDHPGWDWKGAAPDFGIERCEMATGTMVTGWVTDHVVLLVPGLDDAVEVLAAVGIRPRLRIDVNGRPTAFFRVGPILEVIESPVRAPSIYGVAVATEEPLHVAALRWRSLGFDVSDPRDAMQPGRRIMTVRGLSAGLAIMSPDRAASTDP
jgi:hypothetical protein